MLSSVPDETDPGFYVGTLSLWDSTTHETSRPLKIYSNEEVFIGRDTKRWYCKPLLYLIALEFPGLTNWLSLQSVSPRQSVCLKQAYPHLHHSL